MVDSSLRSHVMQWYAKCLCTLLSFTLAWPALACTTFELQAKDGARVVGRSMELGLDLQSQVILVPRQYALSAMKPDMKLGLSWVTQYGFLGINTLGLDLATDGMNEAGLSAHALYIPGFFEYQPYPFDRSDLQSKTIANTDLVNWVLSQFQTVDQVKEALTQIIVYGLDVPQGGVQPLHWAIRDAKGGSIVVEYIKGQLVVVDNPIGVLTNAPNFDWHMTNLRNFVNLNRINVDPLKLGDTTIEPIGQGTGLLGLPGDFTPPSRFLRTTALVYSAVPPDNALGTVNLAFHLLNAVDIPIGAVAQRVPSKTELVYEQTQWATVYDLTHKIAYFRTYGDLNIYQINLSKFDFTGQAIAYVPMPRQMRATDLTPRRP